MRYFYILLVLSGVVYTNDPAAAQSIRNPFCSIQTILLPGHPLGGQATIEPQTGRPIILVDPNLEYQGNQVLGPGGGPAIMRFILAHECAHHVNGDMRRLRQLQLLGPYAQFQMNPSIELEADCWAARQPRRRSDFGAIRAAADFFTYTQGPFSAPMYPSGNQRANTIARCGGR